jgi:hypothetical protein
MGRPNPHLFSVVDLLDPERLTPFSKFLSSASHIAPHVKQLHIQASSNNMDALRHILRSLPELEFLEVEGILPHDTNYRRADYKYPFMLIEALYPVLVLPTLHSLSLSHAYFQNATPLD